MPVAQYSGDKDTLTGTEPKYFDDIDVAGVRRYLMSRQTPAGGFCFYRYGPWRVEEPNALDTWAAIASLQRLGVVIPSQDRTIAWLRDQQADDGGFQSLLIGEAVLSALHLLQAEPVRDPRQFLIQWAERISHADIKAGDPEAWLHNVQRCLRLLKLYSLSLSALQSNVPDRLSQLRDPLDSYPSSAPTILATGRAMDILRQLQQPQGSAVTFLRRCENPRLGITLVPDSSATWIEVHYVGLLAFQSAGECPAFRDAIRAFTGRCQGTAGGFSRVPDALPNLQDTCLALSVLDHLTALD